MIINNRFQAFAIHLTISVAIFLVLLGVILYFWFPNGLIYAGGLEGLKLIAGVDVVLGPLLTLVVFNRLKPGLKRDLAIIATLQTVCLIAGIWFLFNERPVAQVLIDDGVHLISHAESKQYKLNLAPYSGTSPKRLMIRLPDNQANWGVTKALSELADEKPFSVREDLYLSLDTVEEKEYKERIDIIIKMYPPNTFSKNYNLLSKDLPCTWIPLRSKHGGGLACFSKDRGIHELSEKTIFLTQLN